MEKYIKTLFRGESLSGLIPKDADYLVTGINKSGSPTYQSWNIGSSVISELGAWKIRAVRENISVVLTDIKQNKVTTFSREGLLKEEFINYSWPPTVLSRTK